MTRLFGAFVASAAILVSSAATCAEVYGPLTAPPGVYFGSGNPNGNFNISRDGPFELGLRAKNRGAGPVLIDGSSGTYSVAQGFCNPTCSGGLKASWNYEFSIHTTDGGSLNRYAYRLGVDHDASANEIFTYVNPLTYWSDNATDGIFGVQASQNVRFGDTPGGAFNVFTPGLYDFILLAYNLNDVNFANPLAQVDMTVQVVPEPEALALFGIGLASLVALRRRKAKRS